MDDGASNSIAESKESNKEASSFVSNDGSPITPATPNSTDLRYTAERISNDIASTFSTLGATFLAAQNTTNPRLANGQSKGFIDACWLLSEDEPATIATKTATPNATAVPGIKAKLPMDDDNSLQGDEESASPVQRIRQEKNKDGGDKSKDLDPVHEIEGPLSPSRRSPGEVVESWKRKMKFMKKKRQKEANDLHGGDETDNDTKTDDERSFLREDSTFFTEDADDDQSLFIKACQPGQDETLLDPLFSAAMTLEGIPSSRQELLDLVAGKCRVMIGADDGSSTDSEETDDWSDSYMTPESPRRRRRRRRKEYTRSSRSSRRSRGRRDRSRDSGRRKRSKSRDGERRKRSKSPSNKGGRSRGGGGQSKKKNYDDNASVDESDITMTPERSKNHSQRPTNESPPSSRRHHQRTPPSNDKLQGVSKSTTNGTNFPTTPPTTRKSALKTTSKIPKTKAAPPSPPPANPNDKNFIKVFIREISQKGYRMRWYRDKASTKPTTVVLFLQPGHKMDQVGGGSHSGPAMVWVEDDKQEELFYGVNLFDIRTLERANTSLLGTGSYAMPSRSIFLRLAKGNEFLFEAPTDQEAFRFVHGMKWVIARLAFNLVIGNMDVVCELVEVDKKKGEATIARAMDDVTLQMVDKSILKVVQ